MSPFCGLSLAIANKDMTSSDQEYIQEQMSLLFLRQWEDVIPAGVAKQGQMTLTYGKYNFNVCDDPADCSLE